MNKCSLLTIVIGVASLAAAPVKAAGPDSVVAREGLQVAATVDAPARSSAAPEANTPSKKEESTRAPVQPAPAESRTPEEAAKRAADPKDPSGALILAPPPDSSKGPLTR